MKIYWAAGACIASLLCLAVGGCATQPNRTVSPDARAVSGGRELVVAVTQGELEADIKVANGGASLGLIGALIDAGVNQSRASTAQDTLKSVRDGMAGYNFDQRALATAKAGLGRIPWLGAGKSSFIKDLSNPRVLSVLDAASTSQVIVTSFRYALSPDFDSLTTSWGVSLVPKATPPGKTPADRLKLENYIYNQSFACIKPLANPAKEMAGNARTWSSSKAQLARQAIDTCLAQFAPLVQRSMEMSASAREALKNGQKFSDPNKLVTGTLIEKTADGSLVLDGLDRWTLLLSAKSSP